MSERSTSDADEKSADAGTSSTDRSTDGGESTPAANWFWSAKRSDIIGIAADDIERVARAVAARVGDEPEFIRVDRLDVDGVSPRQVGSVLGGLQRLDECPLAVEKWSESPAVTYRVERRVSTDGGGLTVPALASDRTAQYGPRGLKEWYVIEAAMDATTRTLRVLTEAER